MMPWYKNAMVAPPVAENKITKNLSGVMAANTNHPTAMTAPSQIQTRL
jgi:hypothetical protein